MPIEPTSSEFVLFDEISRLGEAIWAVSSKMTGPVSDPKMISVMLYQRLWSNHRGFTLLWNSNLLLEADIILRSAVEVAICIAANFRQPEVFADLLRNDAAYTLKTQIAIYRDDNDPDGSASDQRLLDDFLAHLAVGSQLSPLNWKSLAGLGQVEALYDRYRTLSGISSHVTGISMLRRVTHDGVDDAQRELSSHVRKMHPMILATATLQASVFHAGLLNEHGLMSSALALADRMSAVSLDWPGVE